MSFGQDYCPTFVDRFGTWLSATAIRRHVADWDGQRIADVGSGFNAPFVRPVLNIVKSAVLAADLRRLLIPARFRAPDISCFSDKFGLNAFAVCRRLKLLSAQSDMTTGTNLESCAENAKLKPI